MDRLPNPGTISHIGAETGGEFCKVRVCSCGSFYVTIGAVTMKLTEEAFHSVLKTFEGLLGSESDLRTVPISTSMSGTVN